MKTESLSNSRALIAPGARLNWRPGSIARFESLWSILHKLVYLNDVKVKELTFALNPPQFWRAEAAKRVSLSLVKELTFTLNPRQFWRAEAAKRVSISLLDFQSLSRRRLQWLLRLRSETTQSSHRTSYH
jgi:hypothetical protein